MSLYIAIYRYHDGHTGPHMGPHMGPIWDRIWTPWGPMGPMGGPWALWGAHGPREVKKRGLFVPKACRSVPNHFVPTWAGTGTESALWSTTAVVAAYYFF